MLKKRIIAALVVKDGFVVQSIGFQRYLPVGSVSVAVEFLSSWGIDEIVIVDIDASPTRRAPDANMIRAAASAGFVPLTVGGGIRSVDHMHNVLLAGADKIAINRAAVEHPELIHDGASVYGSQCIVVSMDVRKRVDGRYEVFTDSGRHATGLDPRDFARRVEQLGAGEILLNSIDRDGSKQGFDVELVAAVTEAVDIPVIALGGAGHPAHLHEVLRIPNLSAAAAGNFFHYSEHSVVVTKSFLRQVGQDVRLDTYADYTDRGFDDVGRVGKRPDEELAEMIFEHIPKEVI